MVGLTPEPAEELGEGRKEKKRREGEREGREKERDRKGGEACRVLTNLFSSGDKPWAEKNNKAKKPSWRKDLKGIQAR